ncbi:SAM-dependent methyltransferase [Metallosphaera javensis (ex Sakai et al. 2022)]|uniref:tRNA (N6-threonylcarbamoyladenosine(37)-N6)-methyltransferase TrmO n=1 Tax=Metallosphaera javensis (ex Sakai et al. 2022) TaxID=2775498 RepID=UPI0030938475|nr:MAG: tRNA (N6-threonylcarbamoyladenosine(37)-N6)-methyltransferase TrmO [Metallosphaera javensis (ex Sakai et al. 2022)]
MITYEPIGFVEVEGEPSRGKECFVVVRPELAEGLTGLEQFSHGIIIYHLHLSHFNGLIKVRGGEKVGVFATRSPNRPNPIGISVVEILEVKGNRVKVRGLNAFNGTPVLDIKPYDRWDSVINPQVPGWHQVQ